MLPDHVIATVADLDAEIGRLQAARDTLLRLAGVAEPAAAVRAVPQPATNGHPPKKAAAPTRPAGGARKPAADKPDGADVDRMVALIREAGPLRQFEIVERLRLSQVRVSALVRTRMDLFRRTGEGKRSPVGLTDAAAAPAPN